MGDSSWRKQPNAPELQGQPNRASKICVSLSPKLCAELSPICPWRWRIRASTPPPVLLGLALHIAVLVVAVVVAGVCGENQFFLS